MESPLPPRATLDDALRIMRDLRTRDAWDRAQTHESLRPYLNEEAHELDDALRDGDDAAMLGELGDVLLQVLFHAIIAEERGAFDVGHVAGSLVTKMEKRHPWLYGTGEAGGRGSGAGAEERGKDGEQRGGSRGTPNAASGGTPNSGSEVTPSGGAPAPADDSRREPWEQMKARTRRSLAEGLPAGLPSLHRAHRLQERAAGVGFDWPDVAGPASKVREELGEVESVIAEHGADFPTHGVPSADPRHEALEHELGDLLFAVVNLCRKAGVHPALALDKANAKFQRRFEAVEKLAAERGVDVRTAGLETLDQLWDDIKRQEGRDG